MKLRQIFYWHVFIQWLTHKDVLDEYLDEFQQVHASYMMNGVQAVLRRRGVSTQDSHSVFANMTADERWALNVEAFINNQSNSSILHRRFFPPNSYRVFGREGHEFNGRSWSAICDRFERDCLYNTVVNRTGLSTIKRSWVNSNARLQGD